MNLVDQSADFTSSSRRVQSQPVANGESFEYQNVLQSLTIVTGRLLWLLECAQTSVSVAMYGFNDPTLAAALEKKLKNPEVSDRDNQLDSTGTLNQARKAYS